MTQNVFRERKVQESYTFYDLCDVAEYAMTN